MGIVLRAFQHFQRILGVVRTVPSYPLIIGLQLLRSFTSLLGLPLLAPLLDYVRTGSLDSIIGGSVSRTYTRALQAIFEFLHLPFSFTALLILTGSLTILGYGLNLLTNVLVNYTQWNLYRRNSRSLFRLYLESNWSWLLKHHSGEMNHALYGEVTAASFAVLKSMSFLASAIQAGGFFALALYISWKATLVTGLIFAGLLIANFLNSHRVKRVSYEKNQLQMRYASFLNSVQQNKKFFKASLLHGSIDGKFQSLNSTIVTLAKRTVFLEQLQQFWTQTVIFLVLLSLFASARLFHIGYEQLFVLFLTLSRLTPQLYAVVTDYSELSQALPIYTSIEDRIKDLTAHQEEFGGLPFQSESSIRLENVDFSYREDRKILDQVSLEIPSRSTVALIGSSGSGKSTLLDLLLGLVRPTAGQIYYGNIQQSQLDLRTFRQKIAYVSQETTLLDGTLWYNLTIKNPQVTREKVEEVCRVACLEDLVAHLPQGLDSPIGENGIQLSGGQRQRVALARALLLEPEILILDEATSALDLESEQLIQKSVDKLHKNLMIIVVAHRLSTVKNADRIYVLEQGKVVEQGLYEELLQKRGRLHFLDSLQS